MVGPDSKLSGTIINNSDYYTFVSRDPQVIWFQENNDFIRINVTGNGVDKVVQCFISNPQNSQELVSLSSGNYTVQVYANVTSDQHYYITIMQVEPDQYDAYTQESPFRLGQNQDYRDLSILPGNDTDWYSIIPPPDGTVRLVGLDQVNVTIYNGTHTINYGLIQGVSGAYYIRFTTHRARYVIEVYSASNDPTYYYIRYDFSADALTLTTSTSRVKVGYPVNHVLVMNFWVLVLLSLQRKRKFVF